MCVCAHKQGKKTYQWQVAVLPASLEREATVTITDHGITRVEEKVVAMATMAGGDRPSC